MSLPERSTRATSLERGRFKKPEKPEQQKSSKKKERDKERETRESFSTIQTPVSISERWKSRTSLLKSTTTFSKSLMFVVSTAKERHSRSKKPLNLSLPRPHQDTNKSLRKRRLKLLELLASRSTTSQRLSHLRPRFKPSKKLLNQEELKFSNKRLTKLENPML